MTAWCILHMSASDGLSMKISTAWMGPAGLRSFMATWGRSKSSLGTAAPGKGAAPGPHRQQGWDSDTGLGPKQQLPFLLPLLSARPSVALQTRRSKRSSSRRSCQPR